MIDEPPIEYSNLRRNVGPGGTHGRTLLGGSLTGSAREKQQRQCAREEAGDLTAGNHIRLALDHFNRMLANCWGCNVRFSPKADISRSNSAELHPRRRVVARFLLRPRPFVDARPLQPVSGFRRAQQMVD